jgi:hypothetical protein
LTRLAARKTPASNAAPTRSWRAKLTTAIVDRYPNSNARTNVGESPTSRPPMPVAAAASPPDARAATDPPTVTVITMSGSR